MKSVQLLNTQAKTQLQAAVEKITENLTKVSDVKESKRSWSTMGISLDSDVTWEKSVSIYSGVAGIALYYIELFGQTSNEEHLKIAREAIDWCIENSKDENFSPAFLTGRMGLAYVMLQLDEATVKKELQEQAIELALQCGDIRKQDWAVDDYINGLAGRIHGLMHVHHRTGNKKLIEKIEGLTLQLIQDAWIYHDGLYWDRSGQQVCGLCGFSHGSGGIGYLFLELARYFNNPAFNYLARQAYRYEDYQYSRDFKNWPDLRRGSFTKEELEKNRSEYLNGNIAYFQRRIDMNAWCHGAAGIGLSRLEAYKRLGDAKYLKTAKIAINKTIETDRKGTVGRLTNTLCHGTGGNAEVFIKAFEILGDRAYLKLAVDTALDAIKEHDTHGHYVSGYGQAGSIEDHSLFMGNAGVGLFYLRCLDNEKVKSILCPTLPEDAVYKGKTTGLLAYTEQELKKLLLSKPFTETVELLDDVAFNFEDEKLYLAFKKAVRMQLAAKSNKRLKETFRAERKRFEFDLQAPSHAWLAIKQIDLAERKSPQLRQDARYKIDDDVLLDSNTSSMMQRFSGGVSSDEISPFTLEVIRAFEQPESPGSAVKTVLEFFGELSPQEEHSVKEAILLQIQEALSSGKIVEVK